jgi:hypothetical protein
METKAVVDAQTYIKNVLLRARLSKITDDDINKLYDNLNDSNVKRTLESVRKLIDRDEDRLTYEDIKELDKEKSDALESILFYVKIFLFIMFAKYAMFSNIVIVVSIVGIFWKANVYYLSSKRFLSDRIE